MSFEEVAYRVGHAARIARWRLRRSWDPPEMSSVEESAEPWDPIRLLSPEERESLLLEAEDYLAGNYRLLNVAYSELPIDWHRDPDSSRKAEVVFAFDVPHREPDKVGNVKNIWEKSRHHHLTVMATAYRLTGDDRFSAAVSSQLKSWLRDNPILRGANWASALELGIRLISWVWIERLLRGSAEHVALFGERGAMWPAIFWHQNVIDAHMSVGSSANNHLIGEAAGLYAAARAWPRFPKSSAWEVRARSILQKQADAQTFAQGLNRELAFGYHLFVLEFLLVSFAESRSSGAGTMFGVADVAKRMLEVVPLVTDSGGNLPRYGDGDDGMALLVRPQASDRVGWIRRLADSVGIAAAESPIRSVGFPDAGVYVLRTTSKPELFCLADAGPLGFLSIAAHGHADALSFSLSVGGRPVFVDPGTYAYHVDERWRTYFRSTAAHNTVRVDGSDQSLQAGRFLWRTKAVTRVLEWHAGPAPFLRAEHDGYTRLSGRPVHRRSFRLDSDRLEITDAILGSGEHDLEFRFHLAPERHVSIADDHCFIPLQVKGPRLRMPLDRRISWDLQRGAENAGWYSPNFNLVMPANTLIGTVRAALPFEVTFQIVLE